jgi:hypothetical protein
MPITELYSDYFQKSKTFLFPALGLRRNDHTASINTFISWEERYSIHGYRLIVVKYGGIEDPNYRQFEKVYLLTNRLFEDMIYVNKNTIAYIFNLESFKEDWNHFLRGRYSKLSMTLKNRIKNYYKENTIEWEFIESYLYPKNFFEIYSDLFYDIKDRSRGIEDLKSVGELCSPYDKDLEMFKVVNTVMEWSANVP